MFKVLVATREGQGQRRNDFSFVPEGEVVFFPTFECEGEAVDGECGCRRAMIGARCNTGTTTFKVVRVLWTQARLRNEALEFCKGAGLWQLWMARGDCWADCRGRLDSIVMRMVSVALQHEVGTVLERRGRTFHVRAARQQQEAR
jgi:hypothetical protein